MSSKPDRLSFQAFIRLSQVFAVTTWIVTFLSGSSFRWFAWHPLLLSLSIALFTYGELIFHDVLHASAHVV